MCVLEDSILDRIHCKATQVFPQVAVRIQVPVVAAVHEPLREDLALGDAILVAVVVADEEPRGLQERCGDDAEPSGVTLPAFELEDSNALLDLLPGVITGAEYRTQAVNWAGT